MKNLRHEDAPTYTAQQGFDLFTVDEQYVLMEAQRLIEERYLREYEALTNPDMTKQYLKARMANESAEVFGVLWLDTRHRVIRCVDLSRGTIDGASVYPREVVRSGLKDNASAGVLFHNHPSGMAEPSQADIALTRKLKEALGLIDIRVLDHIVVGGSTAVSMAERGLM